MFLETIELQPALLLLAPKRIPDLRLFRRNILKVKINGRAMHAGIRGQADLYGFWRGGRAIELELKSATGTTNKDQKAWAAFCHAWGIQHLVLKAMKQETVVETVERWCSEIVLLQP